MLSSTDALSCTSKCAANQYWDATQGSTDAEHCIDCPTGCSTCTSGSECKNCETGYQLNKNKLCDLILPAVQPPDTTGVSLDSINDLLNLDEGKTDEYTLNPEKITTDLNEGEIYTYTIPNTVNKLTFPSGYNDPVLLTIPEKTVTIAIPADNNINFKGSGTVTLDSASENINVKTVTLNNDPNKKLTLNSAKNIHIDKLDVFNSQEYTGQNTDELKTSCTNLNLQSGSTLDLKHLTVDNANVGLNSLLIVDNSVDIKKYVVYVNPKAVNSAPILFKSFPANLANSKVSIKQLGESALLQDDKFNVAKFDENADTNCKKLTLDEETLVNYEAKCEADPDGNSYNLAVTKKSDDGNGGDNNPSNPSGNENTTPKATKKKGLSAGAIAGIVIACVVVVAAIIALLVYFLVIKKKNTATTSTQGDSSIAI